MARLKPTVVTIPSPRDDHHALRYCSATRLDGECRPTLLAFQLREHERYLSAFWLEYFEDTAQHDRIDQVRQAAARVKLTLSENGRFVELEVRDIKEAGHAENCELCVGPRDDVDEPSHVGIDGWESEEQGALVAERLLEVARRKETVLHLGAEANPDSSR